MTPFVLDNVAIPLTVSADTDVSDLRDALAYYPNYFRCLLDKAKSPAAYLMSIITALRQAGAVLPDGKRGDSNRWSAAIFSEMGGEYMARWFMENHALWQCAQPLDLTRKS